MGSESQLGQARTSATSTAADVHHAVGGSSASAQLTAPHAPVASSLGATPDLGALVELLERAGADPDRRRDVIERVLEVAARSEPQLANDLCELVARYANDPMTAHAVVEGQRKIRQRIDQQPGGNGGGSIHAIAPRAEATAPPPATGGFDWTSLIVHDKRGWHAPATYTPADQAKLTAIAAARPARLAAESKRLGSTQNPGSWVSYAGGASHGWQHSKKGDAGKAVVTGDAVVDAATKELFQGGDTGSSIEATAGGVVTYDGTVSIGSGWANGMAVEYLRRWFAKDPSARALLTEVGFSVTADDHFAVVDDGGAILTGSSAHAFLRAKPNGGILGYVSGLIENEDHNTQAMTAQTELLRDTVTSRIKEPLKTAIRGWPPHAIAFAIHLNQWDPAGGPVINPRDYAATGGDPIKMVHAFAVNMKSYVHQANGAYVLGASWNTATPLSGHLERFGDGYANAALMSHARFKATFAEVCTNPSYNDCILIVEGAVKPKGPGDHWFRNTGPRQV